MFKSRPMSSGKTAASGQINRGPSNPNGYSRYGNVNVTKTYNPPGSRGTDSLKNQARTATSADRSQKRNYNYPGPSNMAPDGYSPLGDYYRDRLPTGIHNSQTISDPRMYDAARLAGRSAIDQQIQNQAAKYNNYMQKAPYFQGRQPAGQDLYPPRVNQPPLDQYQPSDPYPPVKRDTRQEIHEIKSILCIKTKGQKGY